jgi:hypothetical protein
MILSFLNGIYFFDSLRWIKLVIIYVPLFIGAVKKENNGNTNCVQC